MRLTNPTNSSVTYGLYFSSSTYYGGYEFGNDVYDVTVGPEGTVDEPLTLIPGSETSPGDTHLRSRRRQTIPLLVGLMAKQVAVGVGGFVVILAAVAYATRMMSVRNSAATASGPSAAAPDKSRSGGIRSRMEDRLRRRFDEN